MFFGLSNSTTNWTLIQLKYLHLVSKVHKLSNLAQRHPFLNLLTLYPMSIVNTIFLIDSAPNGILFVAKSIGNIMQSKFCLI